MAGMLDRGALHRVTLRSLDDGLEETYQEQEGANGASGYRIITGATMVLWAIAAPLLPQEPTYPATCH